MFKDKQGEYDMAIADYSKAIKLEPKTARYYYNRGLAHVGIKQFDKAIADFEEFLELSPYYPKAQKVKKRIESLKEKLKK